MYKDFINAILSSRGRYILDGSYHERHHIVPKCMGGTNNEENLIDLYAREHFEAHKLLAMENKNIDVLQYAWWNMAHCKNNEQDRYVCTPEEYEEVRIAFSKRFSGENHPFYGKHHTDDAKRKIGEAERGYSNHNYGKPLSDDVKRKMSQSAKERFKDKRNHPMYGTHVSEETKEKIRKTLGDKMKGKNNPCYGRHFIMSEETKQKMSDSAKNKKPVKQYLRVDDKLILVGIHKGVNAASRAIGMGNRASSAISKCCNGHGKTAYGYIWKYVDENDTI